jgi:hypothetical protein
MEELTFQMKVYQVEISKLCVEATLTVQEQLVITTLALRRQ